MKTTGKPAPVLPLACMLLAVSHALIRCRTWGAIYICTYDGELKLQAEEVQAVLLMSVQEIFARQHEFTGAWMCSVVLAAAHGTSLHAQGTA